MATRTAPRKRAPAKRKPAKRTSRPAPPPEPTLRIRAAEAARRELGGHTADAAAVGLVVLAALTILGLVSGLADPIGSALADGFGTLFGQARYAVPVVAIGFAILLFRARPAARRALEAEEAGEELPAQPQPVRVGVGVALLGLAVVGALHLLGDSPSIDGPMRRAARRRRPRRRGHREPARGRGRHRRRGDRARRLGRARRAARPGHPDARRRGQRRPRRRAGSAVTPGRSRT